MMGYLGKYFLILTFSIGVVGLYIGCHIFRELGDFFLRLPAVSWIWTPSVGRGSETKL